MNKLYILLLFFTTLTLSCEKKSVKVAVTNESDTEIGVRLIELPAKDILDEINSSSFYITNEKGEEIPYQLTYDSLIIFPVDVPVGMTYVYKIHPSDTLRNYTPAVFGDFYPKRRDDISYENELVGFRIYGPGTQQAGEKAFGYDLFFKYPTQELIVPQLYAAQTDERNWVTVDSIRKFDPAQAEDFINSFTYHIDHGKGMDCYAVGPTLGAGVAALLRNDTILYPWCYNGAKILDNGPLRFSLALDFNYPDSILTEHRIITLDSQNHLNSTKVWYEGIETPSTIVAGFPLRDKSAPIIDFDNKILAYSDPTQGENNGRALLGLRIMNDVDSVLEKENHILLSSTINPRDTFYYNWGFAWDKTDIKNMDQWKSYLDLTIPEYTVRVY